MILKKLCDSEDRYQFLIQRTPTSGKHVVTIDLNDMVKSCVPCEGFAVRKTCSHMKEAFGALELEYNIPLNIVNNLVPLSEVK